MTRAIELSQLGSTLGVNDGNVGIGTATPTSHLTVRSPDDVTSITIQDPTASTYGAHLSFYDSDNAVSIGGIVDGSKRRVINWARDTSTGVIDIHNNSVGIGTADVSHKLHVVQESTDTYGTGVARFTYIDTNASGNSGSASTYFDAQFKTGHSYFKSFITGNSTDFLIVDQDNSSSRAAFAVEGAAGNNKVIYAMSNGNVGINTNSPINTLHVKGTLRIDGTSAPINNNFSYVYQNSSSSVDYGLQLAHYQGDTGNADARIVIGGSGSTREGVINFLYDIDGDGTPATSMFIDSTGFVGFAGEIDPVAPIHVTSTATGDSYRNSISDLTINNASYDDVTNLRINTNVTGSNATGGDREHSGIRNIFTSSASGGDTSNEHRVWALWNDVDVSGDSDLVYGTYNDVRSLHSDGTISHLRGDYSLAQVQGPGTVTNCIGVYGLAQTTTGADGSAVTNLTGGFFRANNAGTSTAVVENVNGVYSEIDNDATLTNTGITALFRGDYQVKTNFTNPYGVYITDEDRNYFSGSVGIANAAPAAKLDIAATGDGAALLKFSTERAWTFRQRDASSTASLSLQAEVGNKYFNIENVNQEINLRMYAATDNTAGAFVVGENQTRIPGIDLQNGYILVGTAAYSSNQNKPILIAGTTNWNGTTTNWDTYGFQMRLKSNSAGVPRLAIDGSAGEFACVENGGNVGIGTNDPSVKLHVNNGTMAIAMGGVSANVTYGGRSIHTHHDVQSTSMRGGVLVRNMNDYRSETDSASFMHYDAYTTTATSYAFRAATGATLSDTFWVKNNGDMYVKGQVTGSPAEAIANSIGWIPGYHQATYNTVTWDFEERAIKLEDSVDTSIGAILRAVPVKMGSTVKFTLNVRGPSAQTAGLYLRLYWYIGDLPDGKTHVSHGASSSPSFVQEDDGVDSFVTNGPITSTYTTYERTYTNNEMDDVYVSLIVLNWTSNGTNPLWIRDASVVPFN